MASLRAHAGHPDDQERVKASPNSSPGAWCGTCLAAAGNLRNLAIIDLSCLAKRGFMYVRLTAMMPPQQTR